MRSTQVNAVPCLYLNARSMKSVTCTSNKLRDLENNITQCNADVVAITETWLTDTVLDHELLPPRFSIHRKDRRETCANKRGGGLLLAIDESLPSKRRPDLEPPCEILVCELDVQGSSKIAVILCYRPPSSDCVRFFFFSK
eukprot:GHVO01049672.1.p2 GENE.GHVO01049672.1~~GHVO01049672.1.p2  ORF type:complete len:141 (-),score=4.01 GHVO01049672.1:1098-1520(-)